MDFAAYKQWLISNAYLLPIFLIMAVIVFLLLRLQNSLRERSVAEIEHLLIADPALCAERLENNKLFRTVFRRPVIALWKLQAYMQLGDDEKIEATLTSLSKMHLEPRDTLEMYQQSLSYYAETGKKEEAIAARDSLRKFIIKAKAQNIEPYKTVLEEADTIIGVYVEHNTSLIKKLVGKAEHTKNDLDRGITQYRIAKLAYFKGDEDMVKTYLSRAEKNLKDTAYAEIIKAAQSDYSVLSEK